MLLPRRRGRKADIREFEIRRTPRTYTCRKNSVPTSPFSAGIMPPAHHCFMGLLSFSILLEPLFIILLPSLVANLGFVLPLPFAESETSTARQSSCFGGASSPRGRRSVGSAASTWLSLQLRGPASEECKIEAFKAPTGERAAFRQHIYV